MEAPGWFPDELAHAGDEHLDPEYVLGYDRKAGANPTEDVALFCDLGLNETHTLVDLGTGTGTLALAAAPLCRRVVAVDVSGAMLTILKEKTERLGINNIECVQGGFLTYEHRGEPADFVYSRNALHHLPDFFKALALERIASILRPVGALRLHDLVFSFDPRETEHIIEAWLASAVEQPERGWTRPEIEKDIRGEHITFSWLLEPMLERAGFTIQDAGHHASRCYSAYTCVKARLSQSELTTRLPTFKGAAASRFPAQRWVVTSMVGAIYNDRLLHAVFSKDLESRHPMRTRQLHRKERG